jgi:L-serine deaminase
VTTLRKLFIKLVPINNSNTRHITELEKKVANTETELDELKGKVTKEVVAPYRIPMREPLSQTVKGVATSVGATALYSEVLGGNNKQKSFKITITQR